MDKGADCYRCFLDGDDSGLVDIIREYKDGLILYINGIVGDIRLAEELAEDAFVKIAVKKPHYAGRSSFKTFLYAIGRNTAVDHTRRQARVAGVSMEDCPPLADEEASLERAYIRQERKITLHRALRQLPPHYRQALWLVYFEDMSLREAAQVMHKSVHGMETLVYRARRSLKTQLDKEGFTYEDV